MVSFSILLFFAATGVTLNHQHALNGDRKATRFTGKVDVAWVSPSAGQEVRRTEIVEQLRKAHGINAALSDFRVDDDQVSATFRGPGYAADAFIDSDGESRRDTRQFPAPAPALTNDVGHTDCHGRTR